jgi:hypothetical protein
MSFLTFNDRAALTAEIVMPRAGAWVARCTLDSTTPVEGRVVVRVYDGGMTLTGTVLEGGVAADTAAITVVGGAGGLSKPISAKSYRAITVRTVLTEILAAGGESLSGTSDPSIVTAVLPKYVREAGRVIDAIRELMDAIGATWRVLADGTVWVGRDTWPAAPTFGYEVLDERPNQNTVTLGVESFRALGGTTLDGRRVSQCVHRLADGLARTVVLFEPGGGPDRYFAGFRDLVRRAVPGIDYQAAYPSKVVAQNGDGTLELRPDTERMPNVPRVPIRTFAPGVTLKVAAGARCLLEFEEGDPRRPIATFWDGAGLTEVQLGGSRPIARQADTVTVPIPVGTMLTLQAVAPIPGTPAGIPSGAPLVLTVVQALPLTGTIITGAGQAKA